MFGRMLVSPAVLVAQAQITSGAELGVQLRLWTLIPFAGMLRAIALLPL